MALAPMDYTDWMNGWQGVAIWGTIMGAVIVVALIFGVVLIVKALANRNHGPSGGRQCRSCGMMVTPGNTQCPTCKVQMDWS